MKENAIAVCNPPRRFKIYDKLKDQLNKMVKLKLIEVIEEPSEWQSNLIVIEKPDGTF